MAKLSLKQGTTSKSVGVFIQDSTSTVGAGLTGLVFNSAGLTAYWYQPGVTGAAAITLATLAAVTSAYSSGGFKEIDATNMPGHYRLDIPNIVLTGATSAIVVLRGATNMVQAQLEIELTAVDNQDATAFGLSRLDATISSRMATYTQPTGFLAATFPGTVASTTNITAATGITVATNNDKTGYSLTQAFPSNFSSLGITAGGKISGVVLTDTLTTYTGNTLQTGDAYSRIGAAGAGLTSLGDTRIANLDATVSSRSTYAGGAVASVTAAVTVASGSITSIAGATWDVTLSGHLTSGSTGAALNAAGAAGDPWSTALPGSYGAGTAGNIVGNRVDAAISSRMATFSLPTNFALLAISGSGAVTTGAVTVTGTVGTLDALITALATSHGAGSWLTGTSLDAAGTRAAIGLASANLDMQLLALPKVQAAVYDSVSVSGDVLTLSNGKTQTVTASGRVTSA